MIEEVYPHDFSGGFQLAGYLDIAGRWFQSTAGMVVGNDHGGGAVGKRIGKDFAGMNGASVH